MPERASVFQQCQVGLESTPGTAVAANRLLTSLDIQPTPAITVDMFRPQGNKFPTVAASGKDQVTARVVGKPTYTEMAYVLSGLFGAATITGPNGDGAYTWVWNPASSGPDAFTSLTVQRGSSVQAEQFTHGLFASLGLQFDRDRSDLTGSMIGRSQTTGITLTATPTAIALVPMLPKEMSVFVDTTSAGLGTTRLGRLLSANLTFGDKYQGLWTVDSTQSSFVSVVEQAPNATFEVLLEADAAGMAFLAAVRDGSTRFVRLRSIGPLIAGASSYTWTLDMAAKFGSPRGYEDSNGVYAIRLVWSLVHDATWTRALTSTLISTISAL